MQGPIILDAIELVPVVEVQPQRYAAPGRESSAETLQDGPEARSHHWLDSLADAGLAGLAPVRPTSWHVATSALDRPETIRKLLAPIIEGWGGPGAFLEPDWSPVLDGGLALLNGGEVLVEPTCCSDLANIDGWRTASEYRGAAWQMLYIGHPWLSVRLEDGRLVLAGPHESKPPEARWAVDPDAFVRAVAVAGAELEAFASRIARALPGLGVTVGAEGLGLRLAGLADG